MKLKLQHDTFEEGEFTSEQDVSLEDLLTIFQNNSQIVKTKRAFTINRPYITFFIQEGENYLRLSHFAKDAFSVYYCNDPDDKLFIGNFYKKTVLKIISLFGQDQHDELVKLIPRTSESEKALIKLFIRDDFFYSYKLRGRGSLIFYTLLFLPTGLFFFFTALKMFNTALFFFPLAFGLFFIITLILLYRIQLNHINDSKFKTIKISSGSSIVEINDNGQSSVFNKSEIREVIFYYTLAFKNPFADYSYSKIILKNGTTFNISYMILDQLILSHKLSGVTTRDVHKYYPIIR
jgi:hypothetical protein